MPARLRLQADLNCSMEDERGAWCWALRYQDRPLDQIAAMLGLYDGMPVTLHYQGADGDVELDAVLGHVARPGWDVMWVALFDDDLP